MFDGGRVGDLAMKGLLFLGLVGAAIYALLVYGHHALKDRHTKISSASQAQSDQTVGNHFSSWDTYLPTPGSENSQSALSQHGDHADQDTESQVGDRNLLAASEDAQVGGSDSSKPQTVSVEWAKVMLAAKMHDQASISSPTVRSYSPGTNLQGIKSACDGLRTKLRAYPSMMFAKHAYIAW